MSSISSAVCNDEEQTISATASAPPPVRVFPPRARRLVAALFLALGCIPVVGILLYAHSLNRNIPYFDEIDSAVALLLRLDAGVTLSDFVTQLFAVTNEHRTVTSRLLFAASYALTGTVNFVWVGIIGNAFILLACALLVFAVRFPARRLQLGVLLALLLFHLGNYESFLWSGSSIDHFQVLVFAIAACVALVRRSRLGTGVAVLGAILATFTLAHGLLAWPVGAALLARDRRSRELLWWTVAAAATIAIFFFGFEVNPGHRIGSHGLATLGIVSVYALQVLGAPLAFGHTTISTLLGAGFVFAVVARTCFSPWQREREVLPVLWFVVGSAALIAIGRAELSGGAIASRYLILGSLGWALVLFDVLDRFAPSRPFLALATLAPPLIAFNLAQNTRHVGDALTFIEHRDRAALRFRQHGEDGRAAVQLHPLPQHATQVLASAEKRGLYRMPILCERREFPEAKPSGRIAYHLDEFTLNDRAAYFGGWAGIPGRKLRRGQVHLVLQSATARHVFTTVPIRRPDVVRALKDPTLEHTGFRATIRRSRLDPADYQIGFLITGSSDPEFILTEHRLNLSGPGTIVFKRP